MPVLYEKLPDLCFCCAHIGHQFRECFKYKGQPKEELPYGAWMRAISQAEKGEAKSKQGEKKLGTVSEENRR